MNGSRGQQRGESRHVRGQARSRGRGGRGVGVRACGSRGVALRPTNGPRARGGKRCADKRDEQADEPGARLIGAACGACECRDARRLGEMTCERETSLHTRRETATRDTVRGAEVGQARDTVRGEQRVMWCKRGTRCVVLGWGRHGTRRVVSNASCGANAGYGCALLACRCSSLCVLWARAPVLPELY